MNAARLRGARLRIVPQRSASQRTEISTNPEQLLAGIVLVDIQCPACEGAGQVYDPHCSECYTPLTPSQMAAPESEDLMPCGHPWSRCMEEPPCGECEGSGRVSSRITLIELARLLASVEPEGGRS